MKDYPLSFEGPDHALRGGLLIGLLMKHGLQVEGQADEAGNYINRFEIIDHSIFGVDEPLVLEIALLPRRVE